jgi:signal transduction histidine kinase
MVNAGSVLAVVLSAGVLLVALVVATAVVLRALRASTTQPPGSLMKTGYPVDDTARLEMAVSRLESSAYMLADLDMSRFERSVLMLAEMQPTIDRMVSRSGEPGGPSDLIELTDSRIVAELNHALQTPLRGLHYALRNLVNLSDTVLLQERGERLADMMTMLDSCTSALATFRVLVDTVASVPARQPSLDEAIRAFSGSVQRPSGDPVTIDFAGLPDRIDGFSNHYLLTMLQPLVENAIEGCVSGGTVEIIFADHGDAVEFTVFNPVDHAVDKKVLFEPGETTKDSDRHQGLGVSIVERLTEFGRGKLSGDITDTGVRMRVVLPRR